MFVNKYIYKYIQLGICFKMLFMLGLNQLRALLCM